MCAHLSLPLTTGCRKYFKFIFDVPLRLAWGQKIVSLCLGQDLYTAIGILFWMNKWVNELVFEVETWRFWLAWGQTTEREGQDVERSIESLVHVFRLCQKRTLWNGKSSSCPGFPALWFAKKLWKTLTSPLWLWGFQDKHQLGFRKKMMSVIFNFTMLFFFPQKNHSLKKINKAGVLFGIFLHFFMLNFGKLHLKLSGNIFYPFCLFPWVLTKKHCLFFFLNWCYICLHKIHHFILKCTVQWILPFCPEFCFSLEVAINWSL